jgi:hypothetical protein
MDNDDHAGECSGDMNDNELHGRDNEYYIHCRNRDRPCPLEIVQHIRDIHRLPRTVQGPLQTKSKYHRNIQPGQIKKKSLIPISTGYRNKTQHDEIINKPGENSGAMVYLEIHHLVESP